MAQAGEENRELQGTGKVGCFSRWKVSAQKVKDFCWKVHDRKRWKGQERWRGRTPGLIHCGERCCRGSLPPRSEVPPAAPAALTAQP